MQRYRIKCWDSEAGSIHSLTNVGLTQCSHGNMKMSWALSIFWAQCATVCELHDADSTLVYSSAVWQNKQAHCGQFKLIKIPLEKCNGFCSLV